MHERSIKPNVHYQAELCAAYPSAGACYHWAGQVAPLPWAPLASYVTGWCNFAGNAAGDASFATGEGMHVALDV